MSYKSKNICTVYKKVIWEKCFVNSFSPFLYQENIIPEANKFLFLRRDPKTWAVCFERFKSRTKSFISPCANVCSPTLVAWFVFKISVSSLVSSWELHGKSRHVGGKRTSESGRQCGVGLIAEIISGNTTFALFLLLWPLMQYCILYLLMLLYREINFCFY